MRVVVGALAVLAVLAVFPAVAGADIYTATATSCPRNEALDANLDLAQVNSTLDTAGTWRLDVTLFGDNPTGVTGTLYAAAPAGGCGVAVASITANAALEPRARPLLRPAARPTAPAAVWDRVRRAQFIATVGDPDLATIRPGSVTVTTANGSDALSDVPFGAPSPSPSPSPSPTPTPTPTTPTTPQAGSCTITFRSTGAPLRANRRGLIAIRLGRFSCRTRATVRGLGPSGSTLGRRTVRTTTRRAMTVRVRLNASTRSRLKHRRSLNVKIEATALAGAVSNSYTTTIKRRNDVLASSAGSQLSSSAPSAPAKRSVEDASSSEAIPRRLVLDAELRSSRSGRDKCTADDRRRRGALSA